MADLAAAASAPAVPRRGPSTLMLRVATGVVAVPLLLGITYLGGPLYGLAAVALTLVGGFEARAMLRASGRRPLDAVLLGLTALLPLDAWLRPSGTGWLPARDGTSLVVLAVVGGLLLTMARTEHDGGLLDWATSLAFGLYLGGLMQFWIELRGMADGTFWVMSVLGLSWVCDSAAFFAGGAFGHARLAPRISPKKSVEGAVAGVAAAVVVGAVIGGVSLALGGPAARGPLLLAGFGLVVALATILGDLAESFLKRQTGVKDSGVIMPGHGGMLDRMDSLLFCGPAAVAYVLATAHLL